MSSRKDKSMDPSSPKRRRIIADDLSDDDDKDETVLDENEVQSEGDDGMDLDKDLDNDDDFYDDLNDDEEEDLEDEGEDLLDNAMKDYTRIEALDTYGSEGIDNREFSEMTREERLAVEADLDMRYGRRGINNILREGGWMEEEEDEEARRMRRGRFDTDADADGVMDGTQDQQQDLFDPNDTSEDINLEAFDVDLREWISTDKTRREIIRRFRRFLLGHTDEIRQMASQNRTSLEISYIQLSEFDPLLGMWLEQVPRDMLDILNEGATRSVLSIYPRYRMAVLGQDEQIKIRISELPVLDSIRELRNIHLKALIKISGVITKRSAVYPKIKIAYYDCIKCGFCLGPFHADETSNGDTTSDSNSSSIQKPSHCPNCQPSNSTSALNESNTTSNTFRINNSRTIYRNFQRASLQETPGEVPPGRTPRSKQILFSDDLIDMARPGSQVQITGIYEHSYDYHLTQKSGFPVFHTHIVANHVAINETSLDGGGNNTSKSSYSTLTEQDRRQIIRLSRDPNITQKILNSIAPSIKGHPQTKMALAMSLFSGVPKNINDKHRIRGDVNVLLLGDPGCAKSQLLKFCEKTAPRAVYSAGKGASAVGLTASVHKDHMTKQWTLEGGALVLADRGLCLIDEFDKMNEQDRTSIHEAMEQQSISVSKAGIVASLMARCAVIAAANPIGGRYDSSCTLSENVELTDPILQRFDILCVMQDIVDPVEDERLAHFITSSHMKSKPTRDLNRGIVSTDNNADDENESQPQDSSSNSSNGTTIPQHLLKKYIQYARATCRPMLRNNIDQEKIASLYTQLRQESINSGGVPIAVRHIESMMRMAEAHAKMHLREQVREDDVDASIEMMLHSFIQSQKFSVRRSLERKFAKYLKTNQDRNHLLLHILQEMMRNEMMYQTLRMRQRSNNNDNTDITDLPLEVTMEDFQQRAREHKVYNLGAFCQGNEFKEAGYILKNNGRVIARQNGSMGLL